MMRSALASALALTVSAALCAGCRTDGKGTGPPVPASADPKGDDLRPGAIVLAKEKAGGVRVHKIIERNFFPDPVGEELVMIAYNETGNDFRHASDVWSTGKLTVALPKVRVPLHTFLKRDHRVISQQPVSAADLSAKAQQGRPGNIKRIEKSLGASRDD